MAKFQRNLRGLRNKATPISSYRLNRPFFASITACGHFLKEKIAVLLNTPL